MLFKTLGPNLLGRDFVISDLHGCFGELEALLDAVDFDPLVDRLFSVGDLIDRGPRSFDCLTLLAEPWFHAVLGNHEAMLLTFAGLRGSNYHSARDFIPNGGDWIERYSVEELIPLLEALLEVPLVIRVEDPVMPFNIMHAEALGPTADGILTDRELATVDLEGYASAFTWGRRLIREALQASREAHRLVRGVKVTNSPVHPGLSLTYVGHTIVSEPIVHRSHAFIDCGGYRPVVGQGNGHHQLIEHRAFANELLQAGVFF